MFEFLISVAVLMVLAFPVIAIFALVRSIELSRLVLGLDARLRALEQMVAPGVAPGAPAAPPRAAAPPPRPGPLSFEERFGTRWVVWVGGVALALGGIFLVRYTIQQGLIGPGVRI